MAKESARSLAPQPIGALMLRTTNPQHSLWEAILPSELLGLPAELARVDALLDDPAFFEPFRVHFDPIIGRPSIPIETYLRMMFLKFRYRLGYELLCREVADSISWQRFCRIPLGGQVPHPTTLVKLTRRVGEPTVRELNQALLAKAAGHKVLRTHKVGFDTTVVAANVRYPTDAGLLATAVSTLTHTIGRVQAAGGATRTRVRDRRRAARRGAHQLAKTLRARTGQAKQQVAERTAELAALAEQAAADAARVARNARRQLARAGSSATGKLARLVSDLETTIGRTQQVIGQARTRLAGGTPNGATRLVSLHDPDARPIVKGRLGKPVEFGYKAQVGDNPDGVVLDYLVEVGNPVDAPLLVPAVERIIQQTGQVPGAATADRGYGEAAVDEQLHGLGVDQVAIPRKGTPSAARQAHEHTRSFRRLVKWRTGAEGRISHLKHRYGWDRTLMDGIDGARIWCGHGVLAHNLVKVSGLLQAKQQRLATCQ
jgi:IS5 family transposase